MFPFSPLQYVSATERKINRVEGERGREAVGRRPGERAWLLICPSPWGRGSPGQSRTGEGLRGGPGGQAHPRRRYVGAAAPAGGSGADGAPQAAPQGPPKPTHGHRAHGLQRWSQAMRGTHLPTATHPNALTPAPAVRVTHARTDTGPQPVHPSPPGALPGLDTFRG